MNRRRFLSALFCAAAFAGAASLAAQSSQDYYKTGWPIETTRHLALATGSNKPVGGALVLALDTSQSMSSEEYKIEHEATAEAVNSALFRSTIKYKAGDNSIAIAVVDFSNNAALRVPWVDIRGNELNDKPYKPGEAETSAAPDRMDRLADEIAGLPRLSRGSTHIGEAMEMADRLFAGNPWKVKEKRILDIFGDGKNNGSSLDYIRTKLAATGVTINGFAIINEEPDLEDSYRINVVTREHLKSPDGLYSEPGRVWAVARNLKAQGNTQATLTSFYNEVVRGMKQKISVEYSSVEQYRRILALRGETPDFPIPAPVPARR